MLRTYFLQKFKKYALHLLALQGFVIVALLSLLTFQLLQYQRQELKFIENLGADYEVYEDFVRRETDNTHLKIRETVREEMRGDVFLEYAEKIRKVTHHYIKAIDEALKRKGKRLEIQQPIRNAKDYFCTVEEILTELNDSIRYYEPNLISEIFGDYSPMDETISQLRDSKTIAHQITYLKRVKRDIYFIENKAIEHLSDRLPRTCRGCLITIYYADIIAPDKLLEGDDYTAKIKFAQSAAMSRPTITVQDKGLSLNPNGEAHYDLNTKRLGKHIIEGEITTKDRYGQTKIYPFTHEYTVLPKCN